MAAIVCCINYIYAQQIAYSEPDRDDQRSLNFDIVGKMNGNYLVYKNIRNDHNIAVYDGEMKMVSKEKMDFLPDKILNSDVLAYKDYFYFIYQYQKKNVVYCMAAKMDGSGKIIGEPQELDTAVISFFASNKIYTFINSEDKQKLMVFKINTKNQSNYAVTTSLFDASLNLLHRSRFNIAMNDKGDFLDEFNLDNTGSLVFIKPSGSNQNDNINKILMYTKAADADELSGYELNIKQIYLDDIHLKVDNINGNYLITSFYSKTRKGNIEGLYCFLWNKQQAKEAVSATTPFTDEMRENAKTTGNIKLAFNDFFVQNIFMRKDGGFAIAAESVYSSTRGAYTSRWDYLYGSPYLYTSDFYYWNSPYYGYYYPWNRWGGTNQITRYYADNVSIMSFDSSGVLQWANVINKSQYDDYSDNFIGYGVMNTGGEIHFLFNQLEKRQQLLTDNAIQAGGQINRSPTLHNLDKDYIFMPRYLKQVGA
ncbi:MAG TPA: hypothetical protein PL045_13030, partial [Chitinophagaceae bacterium]|nr:hypothetical protein [Chitinophagaceae bacterium]